MVPVLPLYNISNCFDYLDDYFFAGLPNTSECTTAFLDLCHLLNIAFKPEKIVPPTTSLAFQGIALDSVNQIAALPTNKLHALCLSLDEFLRKHHQYVLTAKRQLLSLIGKLSFAVKVVPAGRFFVRRLLDNAHSISELDSSVFMSTDAADDMVLLCC